MWQENNDAGTGGPDDHGSPSATGFTPYLVNVTGYYLPLGQQEIVVLPGAKPVPFTGCYSVSEIFRPPLAPYSESVDAQREPQPGWHSQLYGSPADVGEGTLYERFAGPFEPETDPMHGVASNFATDTVKFNPPYPGFNILGINFDNDLFYGTCRTFEDQKRSLNWCFPEWYLLMNGRAPSVEQTVEDYWWDLIHLHGPGAEFPDPFKQV